MSAQSARRLKERGGSSAAKIPSLAPVKTLTLIAEKPSLISNGRKSIGKENPNPRSISRVSGPPLKPVARPVPRVYEAETRSRSQPRGRSSSPSDFGRALSDVRKSRVSSGGGNLGRNDLSIGRSSGGSRVLEKKGLMGTGQKGVIEKKFIDDCKKVEALSVNLMRMNESRGKGSLGSKGDSLVVVDDGRGREGGKVDQSVGLKGSSSSSSNTSVRKVVSNVKGFDGGKEKVVMVGSDGGGSGRGVGSNSSKSASRLHEKLAYLEGKVKRIACDIKKTKEMLDMNNTDASKVILSDIQEKILGIEKAVGNVIVDSNTHVSGVSSGVSGSSKGDVVNDLGKIAENKTELVDSRNVSVKGLSCQELEARLFPHHKLLRSRTLSKVSVPSFEVDGSNVVESERVSNLRDDAIEDNAIAQQFLASLDKEKPDVLSRTHTEVVDEVRETGEPQTSAPERSSGIVSGMQSDELDLEANERLEDFIEYENKRTMGVEEEMEEGSVSQLIDVGRKSSTGGWFVSDGESVLLAHDDGSCSFHDIVNYEEKAEYLPPPGVSQNIWRDCWIIRAPGADGCSAKYVVAASAGNTMDSGFCSWDFYNKDVRAFHIEDNTSTPRVALSPLPDNIMHRRNPLSGLMSHENRQWWYRPCGPLIISTASCQRGVKVFDIRDGEHIMRWDVQKPVLPMDYSSPLQWRNRGKIVVAESEGLTLWDVSSLNPQALSSVSTSGRRISALHVNNTDAELGGGVRQRVSSSEAEGNDGVFCTSDSINILDFRQPSGIGLKIPKIGVNVQSVYSRGDSIYLGCTSVVSAAKKQVNSQVLQFSLRKQKIVSTYSLPESSAHSYHKALTQVWGNSNWVMAVSGLGLFVFDAQKDDQLPSFVSNYNSPQNVREVIGPDDMYSPSFDYHSSQILLISRDRPAMWRQFL
ncbi:hypothetical protein vseg_014527 [Gypsophila vaccaria]